MVSNRKPARLSYKESERQRATALCQAMMHDPGNGLFLGKKRDFVLSETALNLWEGIREGALQYFKKNKIPWWNGEKDGPTGHLLSSQIACVNHLYPLRQRADLATALLQTLDSSIVRSLIVDDGFVEFEFIGSKKLLPERKWSRGENCTSLDAAMMGETKEGKRKLFLIEWKYTEEYASQSLYIPARSQVYDSLIMDPQSPFQRTVSPSAFYYEPFYQMMRQTLFGWKAVKGHDHGAEDYLHVHVIPARNTELLERITSPDLQGRGKTITEVWENVLCDSTKYVCVSPDLLLKPCKDVPDSQSHLKYLETRYW